MSACAASAAIASLLLNGALQATGVGPSARFVAGVLSLLGWVGLILSATASRRRSTDLAARVGDLERAGELRHHESAQRARDLEAARESEIAARRQMRRTERVASEREAALHAILGNAGVSIISIGETAEIRTFNGKAERIFDYPAAEVLGRKVGILATEVEASQCDEHVPRYLATGLRALSGAGREVVARRKDGSSFPLELVVSEASVRGQRVFVELVRDVGKSTQVPQPRPPR